jgi:hypothetical protein
VSVPTRPRRGGKALPLRRALPLLVVLAVVGGLLALVPGGGDDGATPAAAASSPASSPAAEQPEDTAEPTATTPPSPATEAAAPAVVAREGVTAAERTVTVTPADFAGPAAWSDGATVRVTRAAQRVTDGTGPGELAGQPQTVFDLELVNGPGGPLDLDAVVVQAAYGSPAAQASPVYDERSADFAGTLAPGATATAEYGFTIPADRLGDVVLTVDVDGHRVPAVFRGAVPTR